MVAHEANLCHFSTSFPLFHGAVTISHTLVLVSTHFLEKSELALASVSTRFSAQRPFDPIKQSSLAVNSRDTKHGFCSRLVWPFVDCKGKTERLLFSSRIF